MLHMRHLIELFSMTVPKNKSISRKKSAFREYIRFFRSRRIISCMLCREIPTKSPILKINSLSKKLPRKYLFRIIKDPRRFIEDLLLCRDINDDQKFARTNYEH